MGGGASAYLKKLIDADPFRLLNISISVVLQMGAGIRRAHGCLDGESLPRDDAEGSSYLAGVSDQSAARKGGE